MSKNFNNFDHFRHHADIRNRSQLDWDHARVVAGMTNAYNVFSRSLFFNPEMTEQYKANITKYVTYFIKTVRHVDFYLQEDQLTHTRLGFSLVTV